MTFLHKIKILVKKMKENIQFTNNNRIFARKNMQRH